ncbi:M61 family metallopeptidase [Mucilaginibacter psychrotolerans]|uniref:M61 family peptidase n=1 Tax=Mucilaginibacter psychrotolerans TaxID=1524096 RepID=A0A4Y8SLX8_9SPHI|nr:PDZ domain-containing protein [Mucilaginibacter psychrotolerans]TFF40083.1 M61 family peptidase [Mucilaginibacter psychrotolerans]
MKKLFMLTAASLLAVSAMAQKQKAIYYTISFPNAVHHEAEVLLTIPQAPGGALKIHMSRSSPGRYATHEFGKNIYNLKATGADNVPLVIKQLEGDFYEIQGTTETVKISYTLFANWTDGTYASVDASHAHLNMPATLMWAEGQTERPIKIQFNDADKYGWKVATQLKPEGDNVYSAPDLQYLMDSPTELSAYKVNSWTVDNNGKPEKINLTTHSDDNQAVIDNFAKMVQRMVLEEKAVFGELPVYDNGEYTFLQDVHPNTSGDGMEHRNSTIIVQPAPKVEGLESRLIGTFSHEFFHSWNVKRIRPKSLEPFNFTHANISAELWFAEGFTQYYGELVLARAGINSVEDYTRTVASLVNQVLNTQGAAKYSPADASRYAVFADAGVSIDPNNQTNMFTSYYTYGGATALALDLRLRSELHLTLDDYMRQVWLARGKTMRPYTIADLQSDLGSLTKNPKFAADFFKRYINGIEKNDYEALLAKAGLLLRRAQPGKGWVGPLGGAGGRGRSGQARVSDADGFAIVSNTTAGTPIYKAGIDAGDVITKADGKDIKDAAAFTEVMAGKKPGDKIAVTFKNRAGIHETVITLEENPAYEVVLFEKAGRELTKEQQDFRNNWLSSKVK